MCICWYYYYSIFSEPGSSVGIATDYGLEGLEIGSWWGRDFCPYADQPWGPPSLLYNEYWVFPGCKWPGHGADHPPPSSAKFESE
jgi:hypothetical protein